MDIGLGQKVIIRDTVWTGEIVSLWQRGEEIDVMVRWFESDKYGAYGVPREFYLASELVDHGSFWGA